MNRFALALGLALFVLAGLASSGISLPGEPEPIRLAAAQMGSLLREPAQLPDTVDWRAALAPGDRVEVNGRPATIESIDGSTLHLRGHASSTCSYADVGRLLEKRPLWRYLMDGANERAGEDGKPELWVRGYRINLAGTGCFDLLLHGRAFESVVRSLRAIASEEGFDFRIYEKTAPSFPGLVMLGGMGEGELNVQFSLPDGTEVGATRPWIPPGRSTLVPSLLAIAAAVLFRRPLLALLCGVLAGAFVQTRLAGAAPLASVASACLSVVPAQLASTLGDRTHQIILGFLVAMITMVGVVQAAGGMRGLMELFSRWAHSARRCQAATYAMGLAVFFDHYANTVLVGATMRPISDRFKIAREKLAYLVDSTAAPVAGLSLFSTWIAFEVSAFRPHLPEAGLSLDQGYEVFLRTLPYRFYSLFTLLLVGLVVFTGRDYGPMWSAEQRARRGQLLRSGARLLAPEAAEEDGATFAIPRARAAIRPLLLFVTVTLATTLVRGGLFDAQELSFAALQSAFYRGSGSLPLLIGALAGLACAVLEAGAAGVVRSVPRAAWRSLRSVATVLALLCLAWMFGAICLRVGTATYLSVLLQEGPNPLLLPVILFALASVVAFATGSSWSTMTILLPLVVGLAFEAGPNTPVGAELLVIISIGSVLEGAIFGDHCSPIADSTVMSSIATQCDHVDHVRTQAPYALLAMFVALTCGYFPVVFLGVSPLVSIAVGAAALTAFLFLLGRRVEAGEGGSASEGGESQGDPRGSIDGEGALAA